jgi:hypothetical protein
VNESKLKIVTLHYADGDVLNVSVAQGETVLILQNRRFVGYSRGQRRYIYVDLDTFTVQVVRGNREETFLNVSRVNVSTLA